MPQPISPEEYLELEQSAGQRHELVGGVMYAMAGASRQHNLLTSNLTRLLGNAAQDTACRVMQSDMKLRVGSAFYYPDVMLVCAAPP